MSWHWSKEAKHKTLILTGCPRIMTTCKTKINEVRSKKYYMLDMKYIFNHFKDEVVEMTE